MFSNVFFDNGELRKYTVLFGNLFKNIRIERDNGTAADTEYEVVPIAYGGREKFIARNTQDPNIERPVATQYPRMAFEMINMWPDLARRVNPLNNLTTFSTGTPVSRFVPSPWNIRFNLYITARQVLDASKILQQILPYFNPAFSLRADIVDDGCPVDLMFVLNDVDFMDNYEGPMNERRIMVWTLEFTLKAYFYGPQNTANGIIRFVEVHTHTTTDLTANSEYVVSNTYPELANTALGNIQPSDPYTITTDIFEFFANT